MNEPSRFFQSSGEEEEAFDTAMIDHRGVKILLFHPSDWHEVLAEALAPLAILQVWQADRGLPVSRVLD